MNKALLFIGKLFIIVSFIWPIPLYFVFPFISWICELQPEIFGMLKPLAWWYYENIEPQILGKYWGYWWPLFIMMAIGFVLCYISKYRCNPKTCAENTVSPFRYMFKIIKWGVYGIVGFFILTLVVLAIYYTLFTKYITTIVPIVTAVAILGYLIYVGCQYYKSKKDE
ncbi:MAG: hypothetical protein NC453_19595 [Muribaculum sp.]|nr:hypothetical protein [Muribaculum sp.]